MIRAVKNETGVMYGNLTSSDLYEIILSIENIEKKRKFLNLYRDALKIEDAGFHGFWVSRPSEYEDYLANLSSSSTVKREGKQ